MGKRQVTVAAVQMQCTNHPQENLKKAEKMVRQAAAAGAQIILLSELFEREYFCQQRRYDFYSYAKPVEERSGVLGTEAGEGTESGFYRSVFMKKRSIISIIR